MRDPRMIKVEHVDCEKMLEELLQGFVENFESASGDKVFQQLMISAPPVSTGMATADSRIATVAIHLARKYGLRVPAWTADRLQSDHTRFSKASKSLDDTRGQTTLRACRT